MAIDDNPKSSVNNENPTENMEDLFLHLVQQWRRETGIHSRPALITGHPAYRKIIDMGPPVLPLIFQYMQQNGGWWHRALYTLTGANPVPDSARGRPDLVNQAWLEWAKQNGYMHSE